MEEKVSKEINQLVTVDIAHFIFNDQTPLKLVE